MPKIVDHDERRGAIAHAFFRVVLERGIEGATTRRIAREAGVSLGVLSHYFGDKDALVLAAFDELVAGFTRRLSDAAGAQRTAAGALEAICLAALPLDAPRRLESGVWLSFWAHGYASAGARQRQRQGYEAWIGTLTRLVAHLPTAPSLARARDAATALAALIDGLTVQLVLRGSDDLSSTQAEDIVRSYLAGLT